MLVDRGRQFVDRHKWLLIRDAAGREIDEFDDAATSYCIVEEGFRHRASARLRPASRGSMTEAHFPALWRDAGERLRESVEITRFCVAPGMAPEDRSAAVSDLL